MHLLNKKVVSLMSSLFLLYFQPVYAGPPFITDDPQPVDYMHWEYYISSISTIQPGVWTGTSPHVEVNYGLIPNVQVHLIVPLDYDYTKGKGTLFGYAYTEFGMKYRFVQETKNRPQIGVFPIVEIPTVKNNEFSNGKAQIYLPVWAQKSWGKLTTYGGVGYMINPGTNTRNWIFSGWEIQYDFSPVLTFGGEIYHHTEDTIVSKSVTAFNLGGFINLSEKFHVIYSVGHSLTNDRFTSSYVGLLWTI